LKRLVQQNERFVKERKKKEKRRKERKKKEKEFLPYSYYGLQNGISRFSFFSFFCWWILVVKDLQYLPPNN
jgi:hypothetical protein